MEISVIAFTMVAAMLAAMMGPARTMPAFECEGETDGTRTINLLEPGKCADPKRDYREPYTQSVELLQIDNTVLINGYRCSAVYSRQVTRCGFNSITYGSVHTATHKRVDILPAECRQAVSKKTLTVHGREYAIEEIGLPQTTSLYKHGGVSRAGSCWTEDFFSEGQFFQNSYEWYVIELMVEKIRGTADLATSKVTFQNGVVAPLHDKVVRDVFEGTIVWNTTERSCRNRISSVYLGTADLHQRRDDPKEMRPEEEEDDDDDARKKRAATAPGAWSEAIAIVKNDTTKQMAGVLIKEPILLCGENCYNTHVKDLVLCRARGPVTRYDFKSHFDQLRHGMEAKIAYHHLDSNLEVLGKFEEVQQELCRIERKTIFNKLQALAGTQNRYALNDLLGTGHQVYIAGAAAYVTKCREVEVTRTEYPNCTVEVPVIRQNETTVRFADPVTWVLQDYPTVIPCSSYAPVRWKIMGAWYCSNPNVYSCSAPARLRPEMKDLTSSSFTDGLGYELYSQEQRDEHVRFQRAFTSRSAVVAKLTNAAISSSHLDSEGKFYTLGMPLDQTDLNGVTFSVGGVLMPLFPLIGEWWQIISGIFICILILKIVCGCAIRLCVLYQERGCGCWLFGAFWATAFQLIRAPMAVMEATTNLLMGGMQQPAADSEAEPRRRLPPPPFNFIPRAGRFLPLRRQLHGGTPPSTVDGAADAEAARAEGAALLGGGEPTAPERAVALLGAGEPAAPGRAVALLAGGEPAAPGRAAAPAAPGRAAAPPAAAAAAPAGLRYEDETALATAAQLAASQARAAVFERAADDHLARLTALDRAAAFRAQYRAGAGAGGYLGRAAIALDHRAAPGRGATVAYTALPPASRSVTPASADGAGQRVVASAPSPESSQAAETARWAAAQAAAMAVSPRRAPAAAAAAAPAAATGWVAAPAGAAGTSSFTGAPRVPMPAATGPVGPATLAAAGLGLAEQAARGGRAPSPVRTTAGGLLITRQPPPE